MDESEICRLFLSVAQESNHIADSTREVFAVLVRSALQYRDRMLESRGITVTVEDVRSALAWLVPSLITGTPPEMGNEVQRDLLKIWQGELDRLGNPQVHS